MDAPFNKFNLVVKVKYGDTLRRFNVCVDGQYIDHDMNKLRAKIINLFKFKENANMVLTYTDIDGDVVTLIDDDELHDAVFRQHLDPLRINVQLHTDSIASTESTPHLETLGTLSKTGTQGTQTPQLSSAIDHALQSVPDPLRSVLSSISHDFLSKAAASTPLGEFVEYFSKLGLSQAGTISSTLESAEFERAGDSGANNTLDHGTPDKPTPLHEPVPQHLSSQNSSAVNQMPEDNTLPPGFSVMTANQMPVDNALRPGFSVMTGGLETPFPEYWLDHSFRIPKKQPSLLAQDKAEGKMVADGQTDVKSIAASSVPITDQPGSYRSQSNFTPTSPATHPPRVTDVLCNDAKNIPYGASPFVSHFGFNPQNSLPVSKHTSQPASIQTPSGLPQVLSMYGRSHGHSDSMLRTFHKGVRCDGCGMHPIIGPRFKSNVKEDFDLCSICFSAMGNEADYTRIDRAPYRCPRFLKEFNNPHSRFRGPHGCRGYGLRPHKGKLESRFIQDVTVLDGTLMAPSVPFTKIWRMRNNGTIVWPSGTQLVWIGGDQFAERGSVDLEIPENGLAVDKEIDIAVDFSAPSRPGRYISYWRMASPSGQKFGQRVWVLIQVEAPGPYSARGIIYPDLNLNLPPEASEQGGLGMIDVNTEPVEVSVPPKLDILGPHLDLVKSLVNETSIPSNDPPPMHATCDGSTPPLPEMPSSSSSYPMIDLSSEPFPACPEVVVPPSGVASSLGDPPTGGNPVEQTLLRELEEMGFKQIDLNKEVLRLNEYNLEQSLNDLCGISEWDPILVELQDMGFCDKERNKKLLIKNGGSIKRVVLDLIAGEKADE